MRGPYRTAGEDQDPIRSILEDLDYSAQTAQLQHHQHTHKDLDAGQYQQKQPWTQQESTEEVVCCARCCRAVCVIYLRRPHVCVVGVPGPSCCRECCHHVIHPAPVGLSAAMDATAATALEAALDNARQPTAACRYRRHHAAAAAKRRPPKAAVGISDLRVVDKAPKVVWARLDGRQRAAFRLCVWFARACACMPELVQIHMPKRTSAVVSVGPS